MKFKPILTSLFLVVSALIVSGCSDSVNPEDGGPIATPGSGANAPADSGSGAGGGAPAQAAGGASTMSTAP